MKPTILILEDDLYTGKEIQARLRFAGIEDVILTQTEEDCLAIAGKRNISLAILDIELPGNPKGGLSVARQLKGIPFLFLTAHSHKRFAAYDLGPNAFLSKPFDDNVVHAVELALARHNQADDVHHDDGPFFTDDAVFILHQGSHHKVLIADIYFIRLEDSCLTVQLRDQTYTLWVNLDFFLDQMGRSPFLRIHRSHAINLRHLTSFNVEEVTLGSFKLPITKQGIQLLSNAVKKIKTKRK